MTDSELLNKILIGQARMEEKLIAHVEREVEFTESMKKHLEESTFVRNEVRDNSKFRKGGVKALWVIYVSITGIIARMLFLK